MTERNSSHPYPTGGNGMAISGTQCAALADLVAGYALYALEPDEVTAIERHRATCPTCAGAVAAFERTASLLPFLAVRATPAPDVKASLFARIAQVEQPDLSANTSRAAADVRPFLTSTVHEIPAPSSTIPASTPTTAASDGGRRGRFGGFGRINPQKWRGYTAPIATTAIPLVLALALLGGWAYSLYDQNQEAEADQARLSAINGLIARDGGTVYSLTAAKAAPQAGGQLLASPDGTTGVLMVHGLTEYAGRTYEVWIEMDGRMAPYDTLELDRHGNGQMLIELDRSFKRCRGIYVQLVPTDDPAGASSANVLWATLTAPGPANAGDPTEGNPQIGTNGANLQQLSTK